MKNDRRSFLKKSLSLGTLTFGVSTGFLIPKISVADWLAQNFVQDDIDNTLKRLYTDLDILDTDKIKLKIPKIAENGAKVPVTISTKLDDVTNITILVEKNPVPLVATFKLSPVTVPTVSAQIKMSETCDVIAIVRSGDRLYSTRKKVKVTIGGCGG